MRTIENPIYTYIEACYGNENEHMLKSRHFANQLGLGAISISQVEGHLMRFLLKLIRPRQIIEIGTLTGLSCQYFIQSLPEDGVIYS